MEVACTYDLAYNGKVYRFEEPITSENNVSVITKHVQKNNKKVGARIFDINTNTYENLISNKESHIISLYDILEKTLYKNYDLIHLNVNIQMNWKFMPATRSYDIIEIGFYPSVKVNGKLNFTLSYIDKDGSHTSTNGTAYIGNSGASVTFKLPSGNLNSLDARLYFDVTKNTDATIITQKAYGYYSHAIKNISLANARNHTANINGIVLNSSIGDYDSISSATAVWNGNW